MDAFIAYSKAAKDYNKLATDSYTAPYFICIDDVRNKLLWWQNKTEVI